MTLKDILLEAGFEQFDRASLQKIRPEIDKDLAEVGAKYGF